MGPIEDTISALRIFKRAGLTNTLEKLIIFAETNNNQINDKNTISANLLFDAIIYNDVYQWRQSETPCNEAILCDVTTYLPDIIDNSITRKQEQANFASF